jgi:zinc and cadmium transporter
MIYFYIILSTLIVSLLSLIGIFAFAFNEKRLKVITTVLVGLSAGTLLGDSFFHLMPEAINNSASLATWAWLLFGIITFFLLEKIICWRHCHIPTSEHHPHPVGTMNLIGDGLHNLIDGIIIAGSFLVNPALGIATTIAVMIHEIPQEISDFGVLIHAGYAKSKAILLNFLSALISVLGAIIFIFVGIYIDGLMNYVIPFTAGSFIYIATADIIPELHKETKVSESIKQIISIISGIIIMLALKIYFE